MNRNRAALLLVLLVLSARGYAQGDDSDDDDSDGPASPELSLHFDKQGSVAARLDLLKKNRQLGHNSQRAWEQPAMSRTTFPYSFDQCLQLTSAEPLASGRARDLPPRVG